MWNQRFLKLHQKCLLQYIWEQIVTRHIVFRWYLDVTHSWSEHWVCHQQLFRRKQRNHQTRVFLYNYTSIIRNPSIGFHIWIWYVGERDIRCHSKIWGFNSRYILCKQQLWRLHCLADQCFSTGSRHIRTRIRSLRRYISTRLWFFTKWSCCWSSINHFSFCPWDRCNLL